MIRLELTAVVSNLAPQELQEWLESEKLHRSAAADGSLWICLNSLLRWAENTRIEHSKEGI